MTYEFKSGTPRRMLLGILVIIAIIVFVSLFLFAPFGDVVPKEKQAEKLPTSEWTTAPEGPKVQVDLPDHGPVTNTPADPADSGQDEAE
ncbi:MAG TPA: hypothetical protein VGA34_07175 [Alteraurantiacibacter sp.]